MQEITGNLWEIKCHARVITTNGSIRPNGDAYMGDGTSKQAREKFPGIPQFLGALLAIESCGNHVMALPHGLVAFPVKEQHDSPADLDLIKRSAHELVYMTNKRGWTTVALPRPGCGRGGLTWETVGPVLQEILDDRFICVTYSMKEQS